MGKKERKGASSLIPWAGPWTDWIDPFWSDDIWDPFWGGGGNLLWDTTGRRRRGNRDDAAALANARVDWRETNTAHIFIAELPGGVRKEEVKVQVEDGNVLSISGEKTKEEADAGDTWHRVERRWGSFNRKFRLPENARMDETKCSMDNGMLTVTIPKLAEEEKPPNVRSICQTLWLVGPAAGPAKRK